MANKRDLKAYVRYDGSGRVVPGSNILQRNKPKVGNWKQIDADACCNPIPIQYNFDITADWSLTDPVVVDEASFRAFLEGQGFTDIVISDFSIVDNRLRCNLSASGTNIYLVYINMTSFLGVGNLQGLLYLNLYHNQLTTFDPFYLPNTLEKIFLEHNQLTNFNPSNALPDSLEEIYLQYNLLTTFDPTIPLPNSLKRIRLDNNQLTTFDPSIPLPNLFLYDVDLSNNQLTEFNPTLPLPNSLLVLPLNGNQLTTFDPSIPLPNSLIGLYLSFNLFTEFNPSIPLPNSLSTLNLSSNQMTTAGYTASELWANSMGVIPGRGNIFISGNIDSISGTTLETILIAKGWSVYG